MLKLKTELPPHVTDSFNLYRKLFFMLFRLRFSLLQLKFCSAWIGSTTYHKTEKIKTTWSTPLQTNYSTDATRHYIRLHKNNENVFYKNQFVELLLLNAARNHILFCWTNSSPKFWMEKIDFQKLNLFCSLIRQWLSKIVEWPLRSSNKEVFLLGHCIDKMGKFRDDSVNPYCC